MILLVGMGFFGVSFGLPVFFQGLGFGFVQGHGLAFTYKVTMQAHPNNSCLYLQP
jgi:hypothetical protein